MHPVLLFDTDNKKFGSRDTALSTMTRLHDARPKNPGSTPGRDKKLISQSSRTYVSHPDFYSTGTRCSSPGRETVHSPPPSDQVKNE